MVRSGEYDQGDRRKGEQSPGQRARPQLGAVSGAKDAVPSLESDSPAPVPARRAVRDITSVTDQGRAPQDTGLQAVSAEGQKKTTVRVRQPWDGSAEQQEGDTREPLVRSITECGDNRPKDEKVAVIARASDLMAKLGANPELVASMRQAEDATMELGHQVLRRKPTNEERKDTEGRGIYYRNVKVGEGEHASKATVYEKGGGSGDTFTDEEEAEFTGFPSEHGKLFFDDPHTHHPRIPGADYIPKALLELVNATTEFAKKAEKKGWTSVDQVLADGYSVPLSVTHFKELSEHLKERVEREREQTTDQGVKDALNFDDTFFGVGTVMHLVPSHIRVTKGSMNEEEDAQGFKRITDPATYITVGSTMRDLLDSGYVLEPFSAHIANVYADGTAVADSAAKIFLGDCKGQTLRYGSSTIEVPASLQQIALLAKQLYRPDFLTPQAYPIPGTGITAKDVKELQESFWGEFAKGAIDEEAVRKMGKLYPFFRTEFILATATRLVVQHQKEGWEETSRQRKALMEEFSAYSVPQTYEKLLEVHLDDIELMALYDVLGTDKLPLLAMSRFLESGNLHMVHEPKRARKGKSQRLVDVVALANDIYKVPDDKLDTRDQLLKNVGQYYGTRDIFRLSRRPDQIAAFDGMQIKLLRAYLNEGKYNEALVIFDILRGSHEPGFRDSYRSDGMPEPADLYYPRLVSLIGTDNPEALGDLFIRFSFDKELYTFAHATKPLSDETVVFGATEPPRPDPERLIRALIGTYSTEPKKRMHIYRWLKAYNENREHLDNPQLTDAQRTKVERKLHDSAIQIRKTFPELAFGHACIMADHFKSSDPARAEQNRLAAEAYYETQMEDRIYFFEDPFLLRDPSPEQRRMQYTDLAKDYADFGYTFLADIFTKIATGEMTRFGWPPEPTETEEQQA